MSTFYTLSPKGVTSRPRSTGWAMLFTLVPLVLVQTLVAANSPALQGFTSSPSTGLKLKAYLAVRPRPTNLKKQSSKTLLPFGDGATPKCPSTEAPNQLDWFPASHWNSFARPDSRVQLRLIVHNTNPTRKLFSGELRWAFRPWSRAAILPGKTDRIIQRERIAPTKIADRGAVALDLVFHTRRVGRYCLTWQSGHSREILAQVMCIDAPTGIRIPVTESHWISAMPRFAPGWPDRHFALQVVSLVEHSGIKRYWLTLTSGDPINRRQRLFSTALHTLGGQMLLRIVYPIIPSDISQLRYTATSRWLKTAMHRLAAVADIEPVFLVQPQNVQKYLPLMERIFASDSAMARLRHVRTLLPIRSFMVFNKQYCAQAAGVVIPESTTPSLLLTMARVRNSSLPIWALPDLGQSLNSDRPAARFVHDPATVVGVAAPWRGHNVGWLVHVLGDAVWLQNQSLPGWGHASLFTSAHKSVAVISQLMPPEVKAAWNLHQVWLPNRMVGSDIFKDMQLQPYDSGSYMQVTDPDSAIAVFNLRGQFLAPLYPGLPRMPATDAGAILICRESASYLLAALRTTSIHLEPHIASIAFITHRKKHPVREPPRHAATEVVTIKPRYLKPWMVITINTHSTMAQAVQVAAVIDGSQYKLVDPADISFNPRKHTLCVRLQPPSRCKQFIIALHGQRRTWLATLTLRAAKKCPRHGSIAPLSLTPQPPQINSHGDGP